MDVEIGDGEEDRMVVWRRKRDLGTGRLDLIGMVAGKLAHAAMKAAVVADVETSLYLRLRFSNLED